MDAIRATAALGSLLSILLLGASPAACTGDGDTGQRFTFHQVKKRAEELAQQPYREPAPLPDVLRRLTYDQYRLIAFRHERALWRELQLPFWVEFHHRGFVSRDKVEAFLVEDGRQRRFPFDPGLFQYRGALASFKPPADDGFAGFRLLCRLPQRPHYQEFCSFQGASYFRAVCTNQVYGASARGLAVDIGMSEPEEFPWFRTFWIERPELDARTMRVWALLDGPSVTGAYQFLITPGLEQTTLDIDCELYCRRAMKKLALAPISSMWAFGPHDRPVGDARLQAHDSDGLLIAGASGEWLWRPLTSRARLALSQFHFDGLRGFGLMQRDRDVEHYRDYEAEYHRRPSVWIRPRRPWGEGTVELLELPSGLEWADNVAACWVPKEPFRSGETRSLTYQVAFAKSDPGEHGGGRFVATQIERRSGRAVGFTLDMDSASLRALPAEASLQPVVTASHGRIVEPVCARMPGGSWQLRFRLAPDDNRPCELRAYVQQGEHVLTETWSFLCP